MRRWIFGRSHSRASLWLLIIFSALVVEHPTWAFSILIIGLVWLGVFEEPEISIAEAVDAEREACAVTCEGTTPGLYGFSCGYCKANLSTPFTGYAEAEDFAQALGWRLTLGHDDGWGGNAHNTCPNCVQGFEDRVPIGMNKSDPVMIQNAVDEWRKSHAPD